MIFSKLFKIKKQTEKCAENRFTRTGYYKYIKSKDYLLKFNQMSKRKTSKKTCIEKNNHICKVNYN